MDQLGNTIRSRGQGADLRVVWCSVDRWFRVGPGRIARSSGTTLYLPGSLVLAALLVVVVGSRVPGGHRVSDGVAALDAAGAAWTPITGGGNGSYSHGVPGSLRRFVRGRSRSLARV